jgi:hypothetical protein|tara:strand:+ start:17888 stop:18373 length:486 start_codon:yes stop_codon:yes gene_type:complete
MTLTAKALSLLLVGVILTGCISNLVGDDDPEIVIEEPTPQWTYYNDTYMFENAMAMGHATTWEYNMTVNSTMTVTWDIQCRFEQPLFGEAGYVNITLDRDGVILVSEEYTSPESAWFNMTFTASNITGDDFSLRIQSVGSDHTLSGGMEDYYIVETAIEYI